MPEVPIVDGHLDLAELSTLFGRDLTISVADARTRRLHPKATVSLPDMKAGGVALALATVTAGSRHHNTAGHAQGSTPCASASGLVLFG